MKALVKTEKGVGHLALMDMPEPKPGPGEVLIEVQASGICGTDVHVKYDRFPYWPPVILGHEFAGIIVELGPGCKHYEQGDRVVGEPHTRHCGQCHFCRTGNVQICSHKRSPGWGIHGSMARYLVMPEQLLHRIPDTMDFDTAAVVEPTANAVHDLCERAGVTAGDFVVVLGPGPIGVLAGLTARAAGARHVVMVGAPPDEESRLDKARQLGFPTVLNVAKAFGGTGEDTWTWVACDAPVLLYALLAMGLGEDPRVRRAVEHLVGLVEENGWRCVAAPELGKFRGPGRRADPCPIVNLYALKALAQVPDLREGPAARAGCEMLLWHWEHQSERKLYMFGIGTDFRKCKYPFVWYDVLHVVDTLRRFPFLHANPRFLEMVEVIAAQAGEDGRYTARSMYRAWKGWSFAGKKQPSPWLTFLALRIFESVEA